MLDMFGSKGWIDVVVTRTCGAGSDRTAIDRNAARCVITLPLEDANGEISQTRHTRHSIQKMWAILSLKPVLCVNYA